MNDSNSEEKSEKQYAYVMDFTCVYDMVPVHRS